MTPQEELIKIINDLGITKQKVSEILGLSYNTVKGMFAPSQVRNKINSEHVNKIKRYLKDYISQLD